MSAVLGYASLASRQLARNPRRTVLTFLGLVISFFLYSSLESVLATLDVVLAKTASDTIIFLRPRSEMSFLTAELPRRYASEVRRMDGVTAVSPMRFHFAKGRKDDAFVIAIAVELDGYLGIHHPPSLDAAELSRMRETNGGAIVGDQVLATNDWKVGDSVTLRGLGTVPDVDIVITGDVAGEDRWGSVVVLDIDYLERVLGGAGRATFLQARIERPELAATLSRALDERFATFAVPTETTTEKAHMGSVVASLADVVGALRAIGWLTLAVTLLVVTNAVAMSVRERTVEIGMLRALGFSRSRVVGLVVGEAVIVAVAGGVAGALGAYALFASGALQVPIGEGIPFEVDSALVLRAALLAVPLGAIAGLQPAWAAVRVPITEALGHID